MPASRLLLFCAGLALALGLSLAAEVVARVYGSLHCLLEDPDHRSQECSQIVGALCRSDVGAQPVLMLGLAGGLALGREWLRRRSPG